MNDSESPVWHDKTEMIDVRRFRRLRTYMLAGSLLAAAILSAAAEDASQSLEKKYAGHDQSGAVYEKGITALALSAAGGKKADETQRSADRPIGSTGVESDRFILSGDIVRSDLDGEAAVLVNGSGTLKVPVSGMEDGLYYAAVTYGFADDKTTPLTLTVSGNGMEVSEYEAPRIFRDDIDLTEPIKTDNRGYDIKPKQIVADGFFTSRLNRTGSYDPLENCIYIDAASGSLTFSFAEQQVYIKEIILYNPEPAPYYSAGTQPEGDVIIKLEAERAKYKSSSTLYPVLDRSTPATTPYHYEKLKLNSIGGDNWQYRGQWISWEFTVDTPGYYYISMRARQNLMRGMETHRSIYIDGELLFAELEDYPFSYNRSWQLVTLGNDDGGFLFYFGEGKHTIRMEATLGDNAFLIEDLKSLVQQLNTLYRQITSITGTTPDPYRTYDLGTEIPNLKSRLAIIAESLRQLSAQHSQYITKGSLLTLLDEFSLMLDKFSDNPDNIPPSLDTYKSYISSLSSLLYDLTLQPLELDRIFIHQSMDSLPACNATFWESLWHELRIFVASFYTDYNQMGDNKDNPKLRVWVMPGRDQAQIVKSIIDDTFTPRSGIDVNLSFSQAGLIEAAMAGKAPDVAIGVARNLPVDMGIRGVLYDLSSFKGFEDLAGRFQKTALTPYTYDGKVYGLPDTQSYNVMFYRTDLLQELGIEVPRTWKEFEESIFILAQNNMQIGLPSSVITTLMLQNGLSYYADDYKKTVFSTQEAYQVYSKFISFYSDYKMPYNFDAANRFKTGEMPIVISDYSFFNTLSVLAMEIDGFWEMTLVPGIVEEDGSLNRTVEGNGISSVLFSGCADPDAGYDFLDFWCSDETQTRYGIELENTLGPSGRYAAANVRAMENLGWTSAQKAVLREQQSWVREIEEIPGKYSITRNLNNLFLSVLNDGANVRESMQRYAKAMDSELARKRGEADKLLGK